MQSMSFNRISTSILCCNFFCQMLKTVFSKTHFCSTKVDELVVELFAALIGWLLGMLIVEKNVKLLYFGKQPQKMFISKLEQIIEMVRMTTIVYLYLEKCLFFCFDKTSSKVTLFSHLEHNMKKLAWRHPYSTYKKGKNFPLY